MPKTPLLSNSSLREDKRLVVPTLRMWQIVSELARFHKRTGLSAALNATADDLRQDIQTLMKWALPTPKDSSLDSSIDFKGHEDQLSPIVLTNGRPTRPADILITQTLKDFTIHAGLASGPSGIDEKKERTKNALAAGLVLRLPEVSSHALVVGQYIDSATEPNRKYSESENSDGQTTPPPRNKTVAWILPLQTLHTNPSYRLPAGRGLVSRDDESTFATQTAVLLLKSPEFDRARLECYEIADTEFIDMLGEQTYLEAYLERSFIHVAGTRHVCYLFPSLMKLVSLVFQLDHPFSGNSDCEKTKTRGFSEKLSESLITLARFNQVSSNDIAHYKAKGVREAWLSEKHKSTLPAHVLLGDWADVTGRHLVDLNSLIPLDHRAAYEVNRSLEEESNTDEVAALLKELNPGVSKLHLNRIVRLNTSVQTKLVENPEKSYPLSLELNPLVNKEELVLREQATLGIHSISEDGKQRFKALLGEGLVIDPVFENTAKAKQTAETLNELDGSGERYSVCHLSAALPTEILDFFDSTSSETQSAIKIELENVQEEVVQAPVLVFIDEFASYFSAPKSPSATLSPPA